MGKDPLETRMPPTLPSPPRSLAIVLEAAADPDVRLDTLAQVVQGDAGFAAMALRVVNTARYQGQRGPITSIRMATMRLGVRTLRNLAVCHAAQSVVSAKQLREFDLNAFWETSLQRAVAAEVIAERVGGLDPSESFTAALLLDLGVLALILENQARTGIIAQASDLSREKCLELEESNFGVTRADAVAELTKQWKLPEELALPIVLADEPRRAPAPLRSRCEVVRAAQALGSVLSRTDKKAALTEARGILRRNLDIEEEVVDELIDQLAERISESANTMGVRVGPQPSLDDVLQAANRSLVDLNLSYEELVRKLEEALAEKQALAEALDLRNKELIQLSRTDSLTQLPNRRVLFGAAADQVRRTARYGAPVSMIVADIDHFKKFNDTHGHVFGDVVLQAVAKSLAGAVRQVDVCARAGGEEFAMLLPDTHGRGAAAVAERARRAVAALRIQSPEGKPTRVTVSLGVATLVGPHQTNTFDVDVVVTRLYQHADEALYLAKTSGRNRVRCAKDCPWPDEDEAA